MTNGAVCNINRAVCNINTNYSQGKKLKTLIQVSNCHLLVVSYLDISTRTLKPEYSR
jgi:hypothetical protein